MALTIRHAVPADLARLAEIEAQGFPPAEAADRERIAERLAAFPECFWLLDEDGRTVAAVNGMATDCRDLTDEMYSDVALHDKNGKWQMLFSVVSAPEVRGRGFASRLMERVVNDSRARGKKGVVLTCKRGLLEFYSRFGFKNEGVSSSTHGGVQWYQMRLEF